MDRAQRLARLRHRRLPPLAGVGSAFDPLSVGTLAVWLKADAGTYQDAAKAVPAAADDDPVYTWADQSGNGKDLVQSTSGKRPLLKLDIQRSKPVLRFDSTDDYMVFSPTPGLPSGGYTVFAAVTGPTVASGGRWLIDAETGRLVFNLRTARVTNNTKAGYFDSGGWKDIADGSPHFQILRWVLSGTDGEMFRNRSSIGTGTYGARAMGGTVAVGANYEGSGGFIGTDLGELLIYQGALTTGEQLLVEKYLEQRWLNYSRVYAHDGDSLTEGYGLPATDSYPYQLWDLLGANAAYRMVNDGVAYETLASMVAAAAAQIDPLLIPEYEKKLCFIWGGTNDIAAGANDSTVYANLQTYCAARQAAGWKVIALTMLPRIDFDATEESYRVAFNASVVTNWASFADALVDVAGDTRLDDYSDTTYYDAGGVHLNATGYGVVADLAYAAIAGL